MKFREGNSCQKEMRAKSDFAWKYLIGGGVRISKRYSIQYSVYPCVCHLPLLLE